MDEIITGSELDSGLIDNQSTSPVEVSLEVDVMSVTENSGNEIKYTFTRKSTSDLTARQLDTINSTNIDTNSDLIVNFSITGSAQRDIDYTLAGAVMSGNTYTVTIPIGQETATVTVTPIKDSEVESDEAVKLTLEEGSDYIIADDSQRFELARVVTEASSMGDNAVMSVITNDDPMWYVAWGKEFNSYAYGYEFLAVDDVGNTYVTGNFDRDTTLDDKTITRNPGNTDVFDVFVAKLDKDGNVQWAEEFGGTNNEDVKDIAVDSEGNTYITGTEESEGGNNIFVAKFNKDGVSQWNKDFNTNHNLEDSGIEVDGEGNTYFTGEFRGQLQLGDANLDGGQFNEVFVAKLDNKGDVVWGTELDNPNYADEAKDIILDKEGNAYVFMTEGGGEGRMAVVAKLNKSDGSEAWKKTFGNDGDNVWAEDIAIDSQDNIYITGKIRETVTFDNTTNTILQGGESGDAYVAKLDKSDGGVLWVKDFDSQNNDSDSVEVEGIAVDEMSNTYVTGYYTSKSMNVGDFMLYSELSEGGEGENAFITKFDSTGEVKWAQNLGGTSSETISDIDVKNGKVYIAGEFFKEATFGDKTFSADSYERFLVKLEKEKPEISLTADSTKITEDGSNKITYTFTRKGDIKSELTVKFSVTGSATFNQDFTLDNALNFDGTSGEVKFEAGKETATVTLNVVDDSDDEEDETLGLELAMGSGYMLSATEVKTNITITKDAKDVVIGGGSDDNDDDDDDDDDDDTEFTLTSKAKQTFKFKSKFKKGKSSIKFSFKSKNINQFKEIAVVTVDDDEGTIDGLSSDDEGYIEAALNRSQSIFSLLGNTPQGFGDLDIEKVLEFSSETRFRFLSVKGGTLQGVKKGKINKSQVTLSSTDFLQVSESEKNSFDLDFEGVQIKMKFDAEAKRAKGTKLQIERQLEVIDLSEETTNQNATFSVYREAAYDNIIGFYQVLDAENGGIDIDGDGVADVFAGDENYAQIAIQNRITDIDLTVENQSSTSINGVLEAGAIIVPFLIVKGNLEAFEDIFFPFIEANSDGVDHVMMLGDNAFGFEDMKGGGDGDFNDLLVNIDINVDVSVST